MFKQIRIKDLLSNYFKCKNVQRTSEIKYSDFKMKMSERHIFDMFLTENLLYKVKRSNQIIKFIHFDHIE